MKRVCRQKPGLELWFWHKLCDLGSVTQPLRVSDSSSTKMEIILYFGRVIGLPRWCSREDSACQCRRGKRCGFDSWIGKIPWRRKWQPTPVLLPGKSHGWRTLAGRIQPVHGVTKSRTWLSLHALLCRVNKINMKWNPLKVLIPQKCSFHCWKFF